MQVSVIIPVYNAEKYLAKAVESALMQDEVHEVILIEDASPDHSLKICQQLEKDFDRVKLLRHPNGKNYGAGATRNLGLQNANYEFIAFLDADDYMLQNRFKKTREVFDIYPDADGVYDAVGIHFETKESQNKWEKVRGGQTITTISKKVEPEDVFYSCTVGQNGYFHTDGITFKKSILSKIGFFDEELKLSQDSHLFIRLSAVGRLYPGEIDEPIAVRRIHDENRILESTEKVHFYKIMMWKKLFVWSVRTNIKKEYKTFTYDHYFKIWINNKKSKSLGRLRFLLNVPFTSPGIFLHDCYWLDWKKLYHQILKGQGR